MMNYEDFRREILGLNRNRNHKIKNSYGVYDGFKYYRKNRPKKKEFVLTESQYFSIIRSVNNLMVGELLKSNDVDFPHRMGRLEVRKKPTTLKIVDGKLINTMPIDWDRTLRLWAEDEESYKNKTLIRFEEKEIFLIFYNKHDCDYNNKVFYHFSINTQLKQRLKDMIKQNEIDAFELWQNSNKALK